jgi:hypothetical protein
MPLVTRIERRLVNTSTFLYVLVSSVLSSMATFYMCSIKVPIILNQIYKYRRHCLWNGGILMGKSSPSSMEEGNQTQDERWYGGYQAKSSE